MCLLDSSGLLGAERMYGRPIPGARRCFRLCACYTRHPARSAAPHAELQVGQPTASTGLPGAHCEMAIGISQATQACTQCDSRAIACKRARAPRVRCPLAPKGTAQSRGSSFQRPSRAITCNTPTSARAAVACWLALLGRRHGRPRCRIETDRSTSAGARRMRQCRWAVGTSTCRTTWSASPPGRRDRGNCASLPSQRRRSRRAARRRLRVDPGWRLQASGDPAIPRNIQAAAHLFSLTAGPPVATSPAWHSVAAPA